MRVFLQKNGIIYKSMCFYRRKNVLRTIAAALILVMHFILCKPYITNVFCDAAELDTKSFAATAETLKVSEDFPKEPPENTVINANSIRGNSYWQGDKYEFNIKLTEAKKTGIIYTTENTDSTYNGDSGEGIHSATLYTAKVSGVPVIVMTYPHTPIAKEQTVTGIFVEIPPIVKHHIAIDGAYNNNEYYKYMLDTRGIQMESERFDVMILFALIILLVYMLLITLIHYGHPDLTPTYRGIAKYGEIDEVEDDVENQLKEAGVSKIQKRTSVYTDDWIVSRDVFKLKIVKNHAKPQDNSRYGSNL